MGRGATAAVLVLLAGTLVGGCTSSGDQPRDTGSVTSAGASASSASPPGTIDPSTQPAVDAFLQFDTAASNAQRTPWGLAATPPAEADFTKYSFDPIQHDYLIYILSLSRQGVEFRGTPDTPRIKVISTDLGAKPYATVVLSSCPTPAPTWKEYVVQTGAEVPSVAEKAPPPYLATITVIYYQNHWGVQKVTNDTSRTCSA
jgi:hypothetical protein